MAVASTSVECVLRCAATNGESPVWSFAESKLFWVDVKGASLHLFDPANGTDECWQMPAWIGCCAPSARGALVALRTGVFEFDCRSAALEPVAPPPYDCRRFAFNDGHCDRQGRFFVGPMYSPLASRDELPGDRRGAPMWRYDGAGQWEPVSPPVRISNGLAFSPDGRTLYHSDTAQKTIWACEYDPETASVGARRVFTRIDEGGDLGGPDGACVDRDGFYTCAVFGAGCLLRFDPNGRLERRVTMPAQYVTMPAFGGPDSKTLFVTSASFPLDADERRERPLEGALFALDAPAPGLVPSPYMPSIPRSSP
jgi:sugar lactone lactonase YvrE